MHPSESRYQIKRKKTSHNLITLPYVVTLLSPTLVTRTNEEIMAEVTAVKTPPFNFNDPELWLSTCERTFALGLPNGITYTTTKFDYIVSNLPPEATAIVRDLIITPDETDTYGAIQAQLIQRTSELSQQEIRKLLTVEELGDKNPSELLRTMNRRAASHNVSKELMLELFFSSYRPQCKLSWHPSSL
ncbi:transposon Tf2-9 polyprotein [Trichonephila clavipes]|nr:transposon Tf2-9 polyprotein [Trichonephila clavipes]